MTTTTKIANRLIDEKSPYLLQHAYNPVNWYPWGDEAFERAKSENKPIFLSIGYSTCHWCHVMEKESFEDNDVANILNESFLAIKVDREERPDIDHIYMNVCQALTGSGGWPLSIFMTADKKPFFAGTYFPKKDRYGMQGFLTILESIKNAWDTKYEHLLLSSDQILNAISNLDELPKESDFEKIKSNVIEKAFEQFKADFDLVYGGFGNAPKFPTPHNLYFLLRYYYKTKNQSALSMVEKTLDSIYRGGIFDHIGFGFSRYSTDRKWLVPHFEKMLYDNALLAIAYLETYQVTKNQKYADIAEKIFTYVTRDMTSKEGGFYSAEDADSEGVEGKFYIFSVDEINSILGENDGIKFCSYYKITSKGNFEGKNILNRIDENKQDVDMEFINSCREKIFQSRENRVHPYKDDKILTAWNGLMIAAMAMSGRILGKKEYTLIAEQAVDFINHKLIREDGRLLARYRDGHAAILAYVDDYAFLIWGLIELYETTYNVKYLKKAVDLNKDLINYFWDEKMGGLFIYGSDSEQLITRPKEIYDGAMPSGNSVAAVNFLRLARLTGDFDLEEKANQLVKAFSKNLKEYPKAYSFSLLAILLMESGSKEVVIVSDEENDRTSQMIDILQSEFHPFTVSIFYSKRNENIEKIIPYLKDYTVVENKSTAYICKNFSCQAPITDIDNLRQAMEE